MVLMNAYDIAPVSCQQMGKDSFEVDKPVGAPAMLVSAEV